MNELYKKYIQTVSNLYPIRSIMWGNEQKSLGDYNEEEINKYISLLDELIKCKDATSVFLRKTELRRYELAEMKQWLSPIFYVTHSLNTLSIHFRTYQFYLGDRSNNIGLLIQDLPKLLENCKENIGKIQQSKVDCSYAISCIDKELSCLNKAFEQGNLSQNEIAVIKEFGVALKHEIKQHMDKSKVALAPFGKKKIHRLLYLDTGVDIDFDLFYQDLINHLNNINSKNEGIKNRNLEMSQPIIPSIINVFESEFSPPKNVFEDIQCIKSTDIYGEKHLVFSYLPDLRISSLSNEGIFINNKYVSIADNQNTLKLIHEIYPGHHYINKYIIGDKAIESKLFSNILIDEGWAQYCEYLYSKKVGDFVEFNEKMRKKIILAIVALNIHVYKLTISEVREIIKNISDLDKKQIDNVIVQAYISPIEAIAYILGFYYIYAEFKKINFAIDENRVRKLIHSKLSEDMGVKYEEIRYA